MGERCVLSWLKLRRLSLSTFIFPHLRLSKRQTNCSTFRTRGSTDERRWSQEFSTTHPHPDSNVGSNSKVEGNILWGVDGQKSLAFYGRGFSWKLTNHLAIWEAFNQSAAQNLQTLPCYCLPMCLFNCTQLNPCWKQGIIYTCQDAFQARTPREKSVFKLTDAALIIAHHTHLWN